MNALTEFRDVTSPEREESWRQQLVSAEEDAEDISSQWQNDQAVQVLPSVAKHSCITCYVHRWSCSSCFITRLHL